VHSRAELNLLFDQGSSVSIATRLRVRRPGFDSRYGQGFFPPRHSVRTNFGAHRASYPMDTWDYFPGNRAVRA
jgi:hypothetical protein